ncbi:hypothetical protein [Jatrophihabitans sp.]|uniref:hypothetical protein n=1 Tax=Jatrophihabitans sp. TaxID=1932789 RepID=UPI002C3BE0BF|nr:hypothetical protein [Jatrophihabitans sp.]
MAGLPASGISAVTVTLTVPTPAAAGSISVFPSGTTWSGAATITFTAASTQQNTVTAELGGDGAVSVRNNTAVALHLVADVVGYYTVGPAVSGGYQPVPLQRLFDTRAAGSQPVADRATVTVPVAGRGTVPASNVSAGMVNLTVLSPTVSGSVSVFPAGTLGDASTTVSFIAGQTEQSMLPAQLGSDGAFSVRNNTRVALQLVIDIGGYYVAGSPPAPGGYVPEARDRVFDSRNYDPDGGWFTAGQLRTVPTLGTPLYYDDGFSTPHWGLRAAAILLTVVSPSRAGSISVLAGDRDFDGKATVSFPAGRTVQRLVTVRIPPEGTIRIRNNTSVTLSVIADIEGYFAGVQNRLHVADIATVDPLEVAADVSCTSASFCMAVAGSGSDGLGRAFRYDGSSWSAEFHSYAAQTAVSCASPTFCVGVSQQSVSTYDGTRWSAAVVVAPGENLISVSCASASFCVTVSQYHGRAYVFDGTGWDTGTVLNTQAETSAVSCPTASFCMAWADGWYQWNGSHWSGTAIDAGSGHVSVSCVSATFCQYVTFEYSAVWNGTSWLSTRAPVNHDFVSISCPAAYACIVNDELQPSGWDGTEWSMPIIRIRQPLYIHVSCPTVDFCMVIDRKNGYRLDS